MTTGPAPRWRPARLHRRGGGPPTGCAWLDGVGSDLAEVLACADGGGSPWVPHVRSLVVRVGGAHGPSLTLHLRSTGRDGWRRTVPVPSVGRAPWLTTVRPLPAPAGPVWLAAQRTAVDCLELSLAVGDGPWWPFGGLVEDMARAA